MKIWKLLLTVIIVLICSCSITFNKPRIGYYHYTRNVYHEGYAKEIPIWIDRNFSQGEMIAIDDAISNWNYVLNGYIKLDVVDTHFDMETWKIQSQESSGGWLI